MGYTSAIMSFLFTSLGTIIGGFITWYITKMRIKADKEEAERQRTFDSALFKQKFIIQRKIDLFELSIKVLSKIPENQDEYQKAKSVILLLNFLYFL